MQNIALYAIIALTGGSFFSCQPEFIKRNRDKDIVLFRRINTEGKPAGITDTFTVMNHALIHARYDIHDTVSLKDSALFHYEWIDPDGNKFYVKKIFAGMHAPSVESAVSLNPEIRKPGQYKVRLYYYRELLTEKNFLLLPGFVTDYSKKPVELYRISGKRQYSVTGDSTCVLMNNTRLKMVFHPPVTTAGRELLYRMEWKNSEGKVISRKRFEGKKLDSVMVSYLPLSPGKTAPGDYTVAVYLFDHLLSSGTLHILPPYDLSKIRSNIILCSNYSKKTGKITGSGSAFYSGDINKVYACISLRNLKSVKTDKWEISAEWTDDKGKTFYTKKIDILPKGNRFFFTSNISLKPGKRKPGKYMLHLNLFHQTIAGKAFSILPPVDIHSVSAQISLFSKKGKSGKTAHEKSYFIRGKNKKVHAVIQVNHLSATGKKQSIIRIEWVNPKGKVFFSKNYTGDSFQKAVIKSSVRLNPDKRRAGTYALRVYVFGQLLEKKTFQLR